MRGNNQPQVVALFSFLCVDCQGDKVLQLYLLRALDGMHSVQPCAVSIVISNNLKKLDCEKSLILAFPVRYARRRTTSVRLFVVRLLVGACFRARVYFAGIAKIEDYSNT